MGSAPTVLGSSNSWHSYYASQELQLDELVSKPREIVSVSFQVITTHKNTECEEIYSSAVKRELSSTYYIVALPFQKDLALLSYQSYQ